ncbi:MAG: T9SS type A sorting domain-containing protein [Ignavibacteriales bacterium]
MKKSIFFFSFFILLVSVTSLLASDFSVKASENPTRAPQNPEAGTVLQWDDGVNFNSIGLTSGGTFEVSARFPASITGPHAGSNLTQIEIFIAAVPSNTLLKIYDQGTSTSPGTLLYSQNVTGSIVGTSWNLLTLTTPVPITGNDIWVGYEVTHAAGEFPCGVDAGPAVVDGDWIYLAPGPWQRLSVIAPTLNYNWNIHAYLEAGSSGNTFFDNFEAYLVGQQLACQNPTDWTTWTNTPCSAVEDAYISANYAYSGTKSFVVVQNNDLVRLHENLSTGTWYQDFMVFIPTGNSGYFNNLSDFSFGTGGYWAMECYFDLGGGGRLLTSTTTNFSYPVNSWFQVSLVIDLNNDLATMTVNGVLVHTWQWTLGASGGTGFLVLDAIDFFGATATDEMYVDDYRLSDSPIPVELTSFTADVNNSGQVVLNWATATEINNQMFEVERRSEATEYFTIGYVEGAGTTTEPKYYTYTDRTVETGKYFYRLKQIDFDGRYEYSPEIEIDVNGVLSFNLEQNYPNPFNPSTSIKYSVPEAGSIRLSVFNIVGEEVAVLVDGFSQSGFFEVSFDASNLPSGVYLYKLQSENSVQLKKMVLLK